MLQKTKPSGGFAMLYIVESNDQEIVYALLNYYLLQKKNIYINTFAGRTKSAGSASYL